MSAVDQMAVAARGAASELGEGHPAERNSAAPSGAAGPSLVGSGTTTTVEPDPTHVTTTTTTTTTSSSSSTDSGKRKCSEVADAPPRAHHKPRLHAPTAAGQQQHVAGSSSAAATSTTLPIPQAPTPDAARSASPAVPPMPQMATPPAAPPAAPPRERALGDVDHLSEQELAQTHGVLMALRFLRDADLRTYEHAAPLHGKPPLPTHNPDALGRLAQDACLVDYHDRGTSFSMLDSVPPVPLGEGGALGALLRTLRRQRGWCLNPESQQIAPRHANWNIEHIEKHLGPLDDALAERDAAALADGEGPLQPHGAVVAASEHVLQRSAHNRTLFDLTHLLLVLRGKGATSARLLALLGTLPVSLQAVQSATELYFARGTNERGESAQQQMTAFYGRLKEKRRDGTDCGAPVQAAPACADTVERYLHDVYNGGWCASDRRPHDVRVLRIALEFVAAGAWRALDCALGRPPTAYDAACLALRASAPAELRQGLFGQALTRRDEDGKLVRIVPVDSFNQAVGVAEAPRMPSAVPRTVRPRTQLDLCFALRRGMLVAAPEHSSLWRVQSLRNVVEGSGRSRCYAADAGAVAAAEDAASRAAEVLAGTAAHARTLAAAAVRLRNATWRLGEWQAACGKIRPSEDVDSETGRVLARLRYMCRPVDSEKCLRGRYKFAELTSARLVKLTEGWIRAHAECRRRETIQRNVHGCSMGAGRPLSNAEVEAMLKSQRRSTYALLAIEFTDDEQRLASAASDDLRKAIDLLGGGLLGLPRP